MWLYLVAFVLVFLGGFCIGIAAASRRDDKRERFWRDAALEAQAKLREYGG